MAESVFEKLLGSYSGMRKRTWSPQVIEEAQLSKEQLAAFGDITAAFQRASQGQAVMSQGTRQNINFEPVEGQPGRVKISGSNLTPKIFDATMFANQVTPQKARFPASFAFKIAAAWVPQQGGEKKDDEKSKEDKEIDKATQDLQGEPIDFPESAKSSIGGFLEQKLGISPNDAAKTLDRIKSVIAFPLSRTKLGKLFENRPDLTPALQSELLKGVQAFFSMAGKVETITLADGTKKNIIRGERLGADERAAGKTITVRGGEGKGGVHFGRADGEPVQDYSGLQEYASAYDHKRYGLHLGKPLNDFGEMLHGVVIVPEGVDVGNLTEEDMKDFDTAVQTSVSSSEGGNDTKGKLAEDVFQLVAAHLTGDKSQVKEALNNLKTRLEKLGAISPEQLEQLESALTAGETEDIMGLLEGHTSMDRALKSQVTRMVRKAHTLVSVLGVDKVIGSERPSAESRIGSRADNTWIVDGELNAEWKNVLVDGKVEISLKEQDSVTSETVLGSNSVHNAYGSDSAEYTQLHDEHMDRAVSEGYLTEQQAQSCRDALEYDRQLLNDLETTLGSLTKPNRASVKSYIKSQIDAVGGSELSIRGKQEKIAQLKELEKELMGAANPRVAAMKLFQFNRIRKAQADPDYAAGAFANDSILSMGSFNNEVIARGSPTQLDIAATHDLLGRMSQDAFTGGFKPGMTLSGSSLKDSEGNVIARNRVAGKERKQFVEGRVPYEGKKRYFQAHPIQE